MQQALLADARRPIRLERGAAVHLDALDWPRRAGDAAAQPLQPLAIVCFDAHRSVRASSPWGSASVSQPLPRAEPLGSAVDGLEGIALELRLGGLRSIPIGHPHRRPGQVQTDSCSPTPEQGGPVLVVVQAPRLDQRGAVVPWMAASGSGHELTDSATKRPSRPAGLRSPARFRGLSVFCVHVALARCPRG